MNTINVKQRGECVIVQLDRGTANAINTEMVDELRAIFRQLRVSPDVKGVILTGKENFFSAGFDLIELFDYDRGQIKELFTKFFVLMVELVAFPKPLVAAVTGHSPAGGCVLAFCADYRIMADGEFKTGMNEIGVGIVVPDSLFKLYSYWIGNRRAYQFLTEGRLFNPQEAYLYQMVDNVLPASEVLPAAEKKMKTYLKLDQDAWQKSKRHLREDLLASLKVDFDITNADVLEQWWSPKARAILAEKVQYLVERRRVEEGLDREDSQVG